MVEKSDAKCKVLAENHSSLLDVGPLFKPSTLHLIFVNQYLIMYQYAVCLIPKQNCKHGPICHSMPNQGCELEIQSKVRGVKFIFKRGPYECTFKSFRTLVQNVSQTDPYWHICQQYSYWAELWQCFSTKPWHGQTSLTDAATSSGMYLIISLKIQIANNCV